MKSVQPPQNPKLANNYWFVLGRQPLLAAAELGEISNGENILHLNRNIDAEKFIQKLGGTIKIGYEIGNNLDKVKLEEKIISTIERNTGKIVFGLSYYSNKLSLKEIQSLGLGIKKQLKQSGHSVRYVQNREISLSSASVKNNNLIKKGGEFLIKQKGDRFSVALTKAVQPFEKFSKRDYGRPGRDDFSGMIPPKLAMMMLNIAGNNINKTLLDPFCGSGTILSEAILLGYKNIIGTDISGRAIEDSKINTDWIKKNEDIKTDVKLTKTAVDVLSNKITSKIDTIVTEPYLGQPLKGNENKDILLSQVQELKKLYISAFSQFKKILKKDGIVVFIIPCFKYKNDWIEIDCLESIKKLGFRTEPLMPNHQSLRYYRPGQKLGRNIWKFIKN